MEQVTFINGQTRLYAIIGDPIEQVRSPEMITWELQQRGINGVLCPVHIAEPDFDRVLPELLKIRNLDGLIFTIPYKARALAHAQYIGPQARVIGAFNAMVRQADGAWAGEMFDGLGCLEAFRRRGFKLNGQRLMLMGLGGAGMAIGAAMAAEQPRLMRILTSMRPAASAWRRRLRASAQTPRCRLASPIPRVWMCCSMRRRWACLATPAWPSIPAACPRS